MSRPSRRALISALLAGGVLTAALVGEASPALALTVHTVSSPDGNTSLTVRNEDDGTLTYSVSQSGQSVLATSQMGLVTGAADLSTGLSFDGETDQAVNQTYSLKEPVNGSITSSANQMTLTYHRGSAQLIVTVRASNDGVAFRYGVSGVGSTNVTSEATTFTLPSGTGLWASPYRSARDYEDRYPYVSSASMGNSHYAMPMLGSLGNNAAWLLLSEAAVYDDNGQYPAIRLDAQGNGNQSLRAQLPGPDSNVFSTSAADVSVPTSGSFTTPWRVVVTSSSLDSVINSHMITDLNPDPAAGTDTSWVKPGKALWSWWSNEERTSDGDNMVASQESYIDSAEDLGFPYITVDCCYANSDIPTIAAYTKKHGVGIFIWKNKGDYTNSDGSYYSQAQLDSALQSTANLGVAGVKIDFMQSDRSDTMGLYQRIATAALKAHLLVNFHGSTKPSGENRAYPNIISTEAILGSEQYKYGRAPTAADDATYPFTRNAVGGMDMTPTVISIDSLNTTQAHQLALSVVFASAMQHFADSNAAYETWVGRHFLRAVPTTWDQSKLIEGFPGNYATIARRSGSDWYIGAITDASRTATIPLSFLGSGTYTATVFQDGASDQQIATSTSSVTSSSSLSIPLRTHGGAAIQISMNPLPFLGTADSVLEAEASGNTLTGSASVSSCAGCSGGSKVGNLGNGASVRFNAVAGGSGGAKILRIGYASQDPRSFSVSINGGTPITVSPPRSGGGGSGIPTGWGVVRDVDVPVTLASGSNTITISAPSSGYAPDIDRIILESSYEAESASRTGNASVTACTGAECSGSKVGNLYGASTLTFTVQAARAGSTGVQIRYDSADPRTVNLSLNGGTPQTITFPTTADWNDISTKTVYLSLRSGANTITLDSAGGYSPDIDRLIVRQ